MFWIVHFWAYDHEVGDFLDHRKFFDYEDAVDFAREHEATVENSLGLSLTRSGHAEAEQEN